MQSKTLKERSKSALAARAKMLHAAHLEWLEGFPLAPAAGSVHWMTVSLHAPAREMHIERTHLSEATFALNKLRIELAPALGRLAEKPEVWIASVERRLELLKCAVHQNEPLPLQLFDTLSLPRARREQASAITVAEPRVRPLLQALSWIHAGHPARLKAALDLTGGFASGFVLLSSRLGELPAVMASLRLLQLAADHGGDRVQALTDCLFDERTHDVALEGGPAFCVKILGAISKRPTRLLPDEPPQGTLGGELARWCEDLAQQNRRSQRRLLSLFSLATPLPLIAQWDLWWRTARRLLREAREMKALPYERESRHRLRADLEEHQKSTPPPLSNIDLMAALREQATRLDTGLERALAFVPAGVTTPGRTQVFIYWTFLGAGRNTARVDALLAGFERYLSRKPIEGAALLQPWREIASTPRGWDTPEHDLLSRERPRRMLVAAYDHLASVAALHGGLDPDAADTAIELFLLAGDSDLATGLFDSLRAKDRLKTYYSPETSKLALRFCRDRPERFADLLKALDSHRDQPELPPSEWPESIIGPLSSGELGEFVRESVATHQWERLLVCGMKAMLLAAAGQEPLPQPAFSEAAEPPDWLQRYPAQLQAPLRRLAAVLNDAEARVGRWLADDFPDAARLQREIDTLELRLAQADEARRPALRTRLDNLRSRLARPATPGAARLQRLAAKLDRAWGRAMLDLWERDIDSHLPAALRRLLGIEEVPPWLLESRALSLLAAATRLKGSHRLLAFRLFRLRCGPPPWDLRDAPQNRQFVEKLPQIDWQPWIEGMGPIAVPAGNGQRLHLALEDDPLEIFRMGGHFKTCLSPGGLNYSSVFANAADINKRVLYARDEAGKVLGRCLLALTAEGELLSFESYCHDGRLGFERICGDFADQLAQRMGTRRTARGRVPVLVASNWYDDGPRDLGRRFPCLDEGSALRQRLATLLPGELLGELRLALKPDDLDETTLPLILKLPELADRPELVVPLLRRIAECRELPGESLATAAHLALRAGSGDLVRRLFLQRLAQSVRAVFGVLAWADPQAIEVLLRLDPARLLAVLRQTRPKSARNWTEETEGNRLCAAAAALDALHRPRQAQPLWQRLATSPVVRASDEQRQRARTALGD